MVFLHSFNNTTLSIFLAGPKLATVPNLIFYKTEYFISPIIPAMATLIVLLILGVTLVIEFSIGLEKLLETRVRNV